MSLRRPDFAALRAVLMRGLLCLMGTLSLASGAETLRVLSWPGYADPDVVKLFEQRHHVHVELTLVSSDDVLWQEINRPGAPRFDVIAANTVEIARYAAQNKLLPLHLENIPNIARQRPRFRDQARIPGIALGSTVYAIPYTYSEMGLIYDRTQLRVPPDSISILWEPKLRGRVLAFDGSSHNFSLAAQHLRLAPFRLEPGEFNAVARDLVELRRNVLTFYTYPEQSVALFRTYHAAVMLANYGRQQLKPLQDAGLDVGYVIPREGALAWLDCWAVLHDSSHPSLAEAWINFMLEPEVSQKLTQRQGLANTLAEGSSNSARDTDARLLWLQPVEDAPRRAALWSRIISGDQPQRFAENRP